MSEMKPKRMDESEMKVSDGPDPYIAGNPHDVRIRLTRIGKRILIRVEAMWSWDPDETERS